MSYADASIRGAAQPDGENTVPIESVNITPQEVKAAIDNKPEAPAETEVSEAVESLESKASAAAEKVEAAAKDAKKSTKKAFDKSLKELEDDPCASTGLLVGVLSAIAVTVGIVQKRKGNAAGVSVEQGVLVGAGIALVGAGYYYFLTQGKKKSA